jgi:DNA primase catalytic core
MPRILETDLERVKQATDLLALVRSRGVELRKHGSKDWIGRCPFHNDQSNPNFIVSPAKGLFHCMVCGKAGNAIQFVQFHDGVSFRHAFELLAEGQGFGASRTSHEGPTKQATVPRLPSPLTLDADDVALMNQSLAYYRERLAQTPAALDYLKRRGLAAAIEPFGLGFADRTLGLRLPMKNRNNGEVLRTRLQKIGLLRESGHEHFNGCVVFPIENDQGQVTEIYGRKINDNLRPGTAYHLYLPGPHVGIFNRECLASPEIILCEAVIDALTFWVNGFKNVTCIYGTEGFTGELLDAFRQHKTRRVYLAYDRDDAGERAATRDAEKLQRFGIECLRVKFPHGMDANEYARKVTPADKSLQVLVNAAEWVAGGTLPAKPVPSGTVGAGPACHVAMVVDELTGDPLPIVDKESLETGVGWAPAPFVPAPYAEVQAQSSSLVAASVSSQPETAAKEGNPSSVSVSEDAGGVTLRINDREWRARGVENNASFDLLKVNLRLLHNERFHLDTLDLYQARQRQAFGKQAAEETGLEPELVQRDLAKVLLELEGVRDRRLLGVMKPTDPVPAMTSEEREEALAWLKAPDLIGRLRAAFHLAGIIGEENNTLIAYLAGVSRKLERPLAIIVQSASAAGKTTLMDAVLSFFPEEERVKYSAMTGQSLYYLGETDLKHKILAVVEEAGAEKASYALKLLQSEGELTIASTGKDPQTGKMVTQEYHVEGPVMIFLTTTAIDLDEELQNRCLTLAVDESAEQTQRIHRLQRERRTLAGLLAREQRKDVLKKLRNAQRLLQPLAILNPFAPELTFATGRTRNRRDHEKYLTLIDAIALFHQHQRQTKALPNAPDGAPRYIEVTLDDIALANQLAPEVLGRSLDELPPQTRRLLGYIRDLMKVLAHGHQRGAKAVTTFSRRELRDACGWSLTQVRVHLERLVELEYLAIRHGRIGSQFIYEILFDLDTPETVAHVGLIEIAKLRRAMAGGAATLAGLPVGVAGQNGHLAGGGETLPPPVLLNGDRALLHT